MTPTGKETTAMSDSNPGHDRPDTDENLPDQPDQAPDQDNGEDDPRQARPR